MTSKLTWPAILAKLLQKNDLNRVEASWAMQQIMSGESTPAQTAGFMIGLRSKQESVDELSGLVDVMLQQCVLLDTGSDAVDIVGTGGDQAGTVNISSMASILTAAAGVPVMKHGSRSASGRTGASEMLEVLGIKLDLPPARVADVFREVGLTFFFAPVFHPAMRHVAPIRKELGVPTTFNFLGPLANPAQPIATSLGVADALVAPLVAAEMAARGRTALVFRGNDGLDELTTTTTSKIWQVSGGEVTLSDFDPRDFGLETASPADLAGSDAHHNAKVALALFSGEDFENRRAVSDIVRLNAAAGVVAYELAKDASRADLSLTLRFQDSLDRVTRALESGAGAKKLDEWIAATQR